MSDSFLYNQEVTTEMLNDIAVDLGKVEFDIGGTSFGVDALNGITAALVSPGVLLSDQQCKPISNGNGTVTILPGTIIFKDGCKKRITEPLTIGVSGENHVVCARYIKRKGTCEIVALNSWPEASEDIDYILICNCYGTKTIYDERVFSRAYVDFPTERPWIEWTGTVPYDASEVLTFSREQWSRYTYMMVIYPNSNPGAASPIDRLTNSSMDMGKIRVTITESFHGDGDSSMHVYIESLYGYDGGNVTIIIV